MNILQPQKIKSFNILYHSSISQKQFFLYNSVRCFSIGDSNVLKGQHIRYIPKKKLRFDNDTPDGPIAQIFESGDYFKRRTQNWKISTACAIPATGLAYFTFGMTYWWAYPLLYLPTLFNIYDLIKIKTVFKTEVHKMWLLQNGDQVLLETYDKMLHKINIIDNEEHEIVENKDHLLFIINNSGRSFVVANKNSVLMDYDIIDRIMKGICVDTKKFQKFYHRLLFRQTPMNLRPLQFNRYRPQETQINSNKTIWKIKNRTIYREDETQWLRNTNHKEFEKKNLPESERQILKSLVKEYGLRFLYPEDLFYKTHKISRKDFLNTLQNAKSEEEKQKLINKLFDDNSQQGRRGILSVSQSVKIINDKIEDKERFVKFAHKYGSSEGVSEQDVRIPGGYASLRDLV